MLNYQLVSESSLFNGISKSEAEQIIQCFGAKTVCYHKGQSIFCAGDRISDIGLVLSGSVNIIQYDFGGNAHLLDNVVAGHIFGEAYAAQNEVALAVSVVCAEEAEILFLNTAKIVGLCSACCACHQRLLQNLLHILVGKNLNLIKKIGYITPKSIRERVVAYLSAQACSHQSNSFEIAFNRQELAEYLLVDRSALSNELSKMQREGLIAYRKNYFRLNHSFEKSKSAD